LGTEAEIFERIRDRLDGVAGLVGTDDTEE